MPSPGNPQSLNRFAYVVNNPLKFVDPSGHRYEKGAGLPLSSLAEYYRLDNGVRFDTKHIQWARRRYRDIRWQVQEGKVDHGDKDVQLYITYNVKSGLTREQQKAVTVGISMHFGRTFENEQYGFTAWGPEDLQSNWLGYYLAEHPEYTIMEVLTELNHGEMPKEETDANAIWTRFQNDYSYEMRYWDIWCLCYKHEPWPAKFQLQVATEESGLWSVSSLDALDDRNWFQKQIIGQGEAVLQKIQSWWGGE